MNDKGNLTDKRPPLLPTIIGTGLGSGFWPWGPGTAGTVLGTLIWAVIALFAGLDGTTLQTTMLLLTIVFTILGTWATAQLQPYWGEDPSRVVIDENGFHCRSSYLSKRLVTKPTHSGGL